MRPLLIARCTCPSDVQAALAHARAHNLIIAVRGGGHSGYGSCEGGVVIDTGPMKHADIDARAAIGRFGAGLTWGELDAATHRHGLAVTGGRVTHTGIAGLTLGSGSGWLERKRPAAAFSPPAPPRCWRVSRFRTTTWCSSSRPLRRSMPGTTATATRRRSRSACVGRNLPARNRSGRDPRDRRGCR